MSESWWERPLAPAADTDICAAGDIAEGAARMFEFGAGLRPFEVLIARTGDEYYGYLNVCAHMEVPLNLLDVVQTAKHHMLCDHHYATFRFADGYCEEGPCQGESLTPVPLTIRDGRIRIGRRPA